MATFSRFHKIALVSLGAIGGSLAYYHLNGGRSDKRIEVHNSWTTNHTPSVKWDRNWDCREPESLVKPLQDSGADEENRFNEALEKKKSKATRHLILIRHGQYNVDAKTDKERTLTELGKRQADLTGQRLKQLDIEWNTIVRSTMTRAQETAKIIQKHLPESVEVKDCQLIEEGAPIPPEPPVGHWKPEARMDDTFPLLNWSEATKLTIIVDRVQQFFQDSVRIEAAFRRYFYRAPPEQTEDSYMLLVCHANVIRFFVCKALQFPAEGWLRISLNHGSITWLSILPSGNVVLRSLGDTGHMETAFITSRNSLKKKKSKGQDFLPTTDI